MKGPHVFAYVFAWTALVATVFLGAGGASGEDHARAAAAIADLHELQVEFEQHAFAARTGDEAARGGLGVRLDRLEGAVRDLPRAIDLERHPDAAEAIATYASELARLRRDLASARAPRAFDAQALSEACDAVGARYSASFAQRLGEAETYRVCLFLLTALLLARLVGSMRELERRTSELRTANRTLEERVEERTRSLSDTNQALERAIGEARHAEHDARAAREAAESASRTKSTFLASMSHEIRTPMTAILGFSEKLLDEGLPAAERVDAVATIRRNGEYLSQLVDDILDLSKIEAGKLSLERVACSPSRILSDLREAMALRAAEKGLALVVTVEGPVPERVHTDPLRVGQVLYNLVANALKFTERGRVTVRASYERAAEPQQSGRLCFVVEDTGIGMESRTLTKLFRPFVQGETSTTRRFGGTGLGLAICHHLVTRLGGSIGVSSRAGHGSTFAFHVDAGPLAGPLVSEDAAVDAESRSEEPVTDAQVDGMRILLVEDGDDSRRLLVHFLATAGARVETAEDGEAGVVAALREHAAGTPFDLVLMDMQMPVLDGYSAVGRLRAAGYGHPIVALTAAAMAADRERCLSAGCDDFCAKPLRRAQLLEKAARWRRPDVVEGQDMADGSKRPTDARTDDDLVALVRMFVGELHEDVEAMRDALAAGDLERVTLLAHRLKGAAGSYGFPEITRQAALLERAARAGATPDAVACEIASLDAICRVTGGNAPGRSA